MWEKDSKIDPDNLHDESLKIPQLHSKYYTLYNTITLLRERSREQYAKVRLERYNYYTGKATAEVYAEEPFPYKVREKDAIQRHLEADDKMNKVDMKIKYYDIMLKFLEEIIRHNIIIFNLHINFIHLIISFKMSLYCIFFTNFIWKWFFRIYFCSCFSSIVIISF